jgi:hypothetical protein
MSLSTEILVREFRGRRRGAVSQWAIVSIFFAAVAVIPVWKCSRPTPAYDTWKVHDLVSHLEQSDTGLHLVFVRGDKNPVGGVYFCDRPRSRGELQRLQRQRKVADAWRGVVFAERMTKTIDLSVDTLNWEENGLIVGDVLLFGDPALLARIKASLG